MVAEGTTWRQWVEEQGQYDGFEIMDYSWKFGYDTIVSSDGFCVCGSRGIFAPESADDVIEEYIYNLQDV